MALAETPQGNSEQPKRHALMALWDGIRYYAAAALSLLKEDPEKRKLIEDTLTPAFVERFAEEYRRMVAESREDPGSLIRAFKVQGWGHEEDMYTIVFSELVPRALKDLPQPYYAEVAERLRSACGLRTGGW